MAHLGCSYNMKWIWVQWGTLSDTGRFNLAKSKAHSFLITRKAGRKNRVGEAIWMEKTRRRGSENWITRKPITAIVTVIGWIGHITVTRQLARYWEWNFFQVRNWKWNFDRGGIENGLITTNEVLRIGFQHREAVAKVLQESDIHRKYLINLAIIILCKPIFIIISMLGRRREVKCKIIES